MTEPSWAIVTTRAMCEDSVEHAFLRSGYLAYVARYRHLLRPHGNQRKATAIMRPVFSGLVFVQDWRGWPQERIPNVIGLMEATRSIDARLSGYDIAAIMERERTGQFNPLLPRPPARGIVTRGDLLVGDEVEYDLSGMAVHAVLVALSDEGKATITFAMLGRSLTTEVEADALHVVSA